jgi:hypothetical protein
MAEKKMKNPCWKGYEAYGMKKKNGKEVPNCVPVKEEIQHLTKQNIISNILESKMKDGPGKTSQRPKSWDKGTKAGSEKRKMREQGKREAREMSEARDFFGTDEDGTTSGLGRNWGVEHEDDVVHPYDAVHGENFEPVDWQDRSKGNKPRAGSPVQVHGIPMHLLDTTTLLPKPEAEAEFARHPNAMRYLRDVRKSHWDSYTWAAGAARSGLKGARRAAAIYTGMGKATKALMDRIRNGSIQDPGTVSESTYLQILKRRLNENENWVPPEQNEFGAAADDMMIDADRDEKRNAELAEFHGMRTHVTEREEQEMHDVYHNHLANLKPGQSRYEAFERAQGTNNAALQGRLIELSHPKYPEKAMSHKDRLIRIHQLINLNKEAEEMARRTYMG